LKKKIISVVGARPNFMKVAPIHRAFQEVSDKFEHQICHTGQHYDSKMSDSFFNDLNMPNPKYFLGVGSGSHAEQTAKVMIGIEKVLIEAKPDLLIVVGDVNSTLAAAITAVKLGIKVAHIEGGLRSFDRSMPEEINRLATDAISDYCFITEEDALLNLTKENFPKDKIYFVGNTMIDSLNYALENVKKSNILENLNLLDKDYVLLTLHRPSNVDNKEQLNMLLDIIEFISKNKKAVFPMHPRTLKNIESFGLKEKFDSLINLIVTEPLGYLDFVSLMRCSFIVVTDSGGIQEETTALQVPCITLRTTTERPITVSKGSNILTSPNFENIIFELEKAFAGNIKKGEIPELWDGKASERIVKIICEII
jgi:UDP-N-acetylglucosamine 2-epimerase (non-hydrolysing)